MRYKTYTIDEIMRSIEETDRKIQNKNKAIQQYTHIIEEAQFNMEKEKKNIPSHFEKKENYRVKLMEMYKAEETNLINEIREAKPECRRFKIDKLNAIRSHIGFNSLQLASFEEV